MPCPPGDDPRVEQLTFAFFGAAAIWLAGVCLAGLVWAVWRRGGGRASPSMRSGGTPLDPQQDRARRPTARDWARAWLWVGGLVLLASLLMWLAFGPRAT